MAMSAQEDFARAFERLQQRQQKINVLGDFLAGNISEAELRRRLYNLPPADQNPVPPKWGNLQEMMQDLGRVKDQIQPTPPRVNPGVRKQQIEDELDIIRGRKPTPKGYRIDTGKIKTLMAELKQLNKDYPDA